MVWLEPQPKDIKQNCPEAPTRPVRPTLMRRPRVARDGDSESWAFDTRRGYSHYSQSTVQAHAQAPSQAPSHAPAQHASATHSHAPFGPTFLRAPYMPVIGALPAIAAGVQSIRKWHARGLALAPQGTAFGETLKIVQTFWPHMQGQAAGLAPPERDVRKAVLAITHAHAEQLALHRQAIVRAIDEGSTKIATACCELFTFMLMPLPAIHAFLGVEAGRLLMRPYTTIIIPAAFLVTAGLQIAHHLDRCLETLMLWLTARSSVSTDATRTSLPTQAHAPFGLLDFGDAQLPAMLRQECIYFVSQLFFWTAFACGMSAASGSMFVGLVSPPVAIVCLMIGVVGTTAMHMGWANAYSTPDRIDEATAEDFQSLARRRDDNTLFTQEARTIAAFQAACQAHLSPNKQLFCTYVAPYLEAVPHVRGLCLWLIDRWLCARAADLCLIAEDHIRQLVQHRMQHQDRQILALQSQLDPLAALGIGALTDPLPAPIQAVAAQAIGQRRAQLTELSAAQMRHRALLTPRDAAHATTLGQLFSAAFAQDAPDVRDVQNAQDPAATDAVLKHIYSLFISTPLRAIAQEQTFALWTQRVALAMQMSELAYKPPAASVCPHGSPGHGRR